MRFTRQLKNQSLKLAIKFVFLNTNENFSIRDLLPTGQKKSLLLMAYYTQNPVTYRLVDLQGETVTGSFYEQELQKTTQEIFRIDEVIFRDKKRALVKWKGYPNKFNSWVPMSKLKKLQKS